MRPRRSEHCCGSSPSGTLGNWNQYYESTWAGCRRAGAQFSLVLTKSATVAAAIDSIEENAWIPVKYPGAVRDPDTGGWISDAEVAETAYTAFSSTDRPVAARLIVRRVKDAR